tara:strand:- start:37307 stop:37936 length:630 start_codon:yes stop_codon:yes gene_type:complete
MDPETKFLQGLIELQYDQADIDELTKTAQNVKWATGWPTNPSSFWNAEAFMWSRKITKEIRDWITEQLSYAKNNLDIGCGAYSYVPSVGLDISEKMLNNNERLTKKLIGDLEQPLSIPPSSFSSVTAIFVMNYIENSEQLLSEIHRVLTQEGKFVMILSAKPINELHRKHQKNTLSISKWLELIQQTGFTTKSIEYKNICLISATKQKS